MNIYNIPEWLVGLTLQVEIIDTETVLFISDHDTPDNIRFVPRSDKFDDLYAGSAFHGESEIEVLIEGEWIKYKVKGLKLHQAIWTSEPKMPIEQGETHVRSLQMVVYV